MSDADVRQEFLAESAELLEQMERDLVALEKGAPSRECLASIFRAIHTTKGTAGFLGFTNLTAVTHAGESLLGRLRDGRVPVSPPLVSALLALIDAVRKMLANIASHDSDAGVDCSMLVETLERLQRQSVAIAASAGIAAEAAAAAVAVLPPPLLPNIEIAAPPSVVERVPPSSPRPDDSSDAASAMPPDGDVSDLIAKAINATIRVDVGLLEKLMNLVGELVLTRNQLLQFKATREDAGFLATSQRLNLITTELQEGVMKARMQPIGSIWGKYPRVVRDLGIACKKQVRIEMEGAATELDRTILEAIKDPLTHLIRNAVDHGVEPPEDRVARGKPVQGRITLRAFHEGGQVNIEIADDGRGIDVAKLRAKAVRLGHVTAEQAARLSERESLNLIFAAGFSTAEAVSNVSGRGVGMDVVRTNVEKIGGTADVQTHLGSGTSVHLKIPLTLAIIPALLVTTANNRFAIPQVSLLELVHLDADQARASIEHIHGAPVYRLRGSLLPLVYLSSELRLRTAAACAEEEHQNGANIVVLQAEGRQFGLVVDDVNDTEEIVVKPLGKQLKGITCFAGATIMGDGRVALILDALGLAQRASLVSSSRVKVRAEEQKKAEDDGENKQTLLLFTGPDDARMAIPLSRVDRLEEFLVTSVERVGNEVVVQYRGDILPLVAIDGLVEERRTSRRNPGSPDLFEGREKIHVVVNSANGRSVGLVVNRILDIVQETLRVQTRATRPGVLGTAVIQGRVTELLDVESAFRLASSPPVVPTIPTSNPSAEARA